MRKILIAFILLMPLPFLAQDTCKVRYSSGLGHEIGANSTLLLRSTSFIYGNGITTLPYDFTYKLIKGKCALRLGIGASWNNSNNTTTNSIDTTLLPDPILPSSNKFFSLFSRMGWELRQKIDSKFLLYEGFDFTFEYSNSNSQNSYSYNNLPNNYEYTKNTTKSSNIAYGAGPVFGFQYFISKRVCLFTEMPIYLQHKEQNSESEIYKNSLKTDYSSGTPIRYYESTNTKQIQKNQSNKLSVTLPVTIYIAVNF